MKPANPATLSVVIPVFNESEVLPLLFERLKRCFEPASVKQLGLSTVQFIFVDDGSRDDSAAKVKTFIDNGANATLIRLSRNFGHQNAVTAGLKYSDSDITAIIDADLQDPPEVILGMVRKWREGFDVVYAQRRKRKENWFKVGCYWAFYRLLSLLSEIEIAMDSGDFCLMDRKVVQTICSLPEKLRFPRGLRSWVGFRQVGFPYERDSRHAGESKYSFKALFKLATDGIASSSIRPLQIIQVGTFLFAGLLITLVSFCGLAYFMPDRFLIPPWFLIGFTLTASVGFATLFSLYIIAGYIGRMYLEIKQRPSFIVMEEIGVNTVNRRQEHRQAA
jgi:polyisoprenyl-phosphate glycosyltransferase